MFSASVEDGLVSVSEPGLRVCARLLRVSLVVFRRYHGGPSTRCLVRDEDDDRTAATVFGRPWRFDHLRFEPRLVSFGLLFLVRYADPN